MAARFHPYYCQTQTLLSFHEISWLKAYPEIIYVSSKTQTNTSQKNIAGRPLAIASFKSKKPSIKKMPLPINACLLKYKDTSAWRRVTCGVLFNNGHWQAIGSSTPVL